MVTNMKPKVSIVIPVYNGSNYICQAVESAINQTYSNIEIIVVNDGSNDNGATLKCLHKYENKIRYFEKENGGVASALNYGIRNMQGDYFAWLSHDDLFEHDKIDKQIAAIIDSGDYQNIAISNYEFFDDTLGESVLTDFEKFYSINQICTSFFLLFWGELHFSSLLFHKQHFERIGIFNESLLTSQDNDFIFRLLRGKKHIFLKESLSRVRLHNSSGTATQKVRVFEENCKIYSEMLKGISRDERIVFSHIGIESIDNKVYGIIRSMGGKVPEYENLQQVNMMIFGAGGYGRRLNYELNTKGKKPICFIDNDVSKKGRIIDGIECKTFSDVYIPEDTVVVIAQKFYASAVQQCKEKRISRYCLKDEFSIDDFNIIEG